MKPILLFLLIFSFLSVYGEDHFSPILEYISRANKLEVGDAAVQNSCEGSAEKSLEVQCARALCGDPSKYADNVIGANNYEKFISAQAIKDFKAIAPQIRGYIDQKASSTQALTDALQAKLRSKQGPIDLSSLSSYEIDPAAKALFRSSFNIEIDSSKPLAERLAMNINLDAGESHSPSYMAALNAYIASYKKKIAEDPILGVDIDLYSPEEKMELAQDFINKLRMLYEQIENSNLGLKLEASEAAKTKELIELDVQSMSEFDLYSKLYELNNSINSLTYIKTGSYPDSYRICDDECNKAFEAFLRQQDFSKEAKQLRAAVAASGGQDEAVSRCQSSVYERGLKKYDVGGIVKNIDEMLDRMNNHSLKKLSSESKKSFSDFVHGDIEFIGEIDKGDQSHEDIITNIKQFMEGSRTEDYQSQSLAALVMKLYSMKNGPSDFDVDFSSGLPCSESPTYTITDYFADKNENPDFEKNKINISMYSALHLADGKAITTHELGHALSFFASTKKLSAKSTQEYMGTRACVSKLHQYETPVSIFGYHDGEGVYVEEDMADFIAYTAYNDGQLHECSLLESFQGEYDQLAIKSDNPNEPHSEGFLRVLREAYMKDVEMPKSCNVILDQHKSDIKFEKCL